MKRKGRHQEKKNADSGLEFVNVGAYSRKSTDEGLDQEYNSLDAQYEKIELYFQIHNSQGLKILLKRYDDGGFTGANTNRPAFQRLLQDIKAGKINIVAVYRYDRLSRSLLDFLQILRFLDEHHVGFVAVTQNFDTTTSIGRLSLNMVMSFAEFESETIAERTRDKMGATRKKGMWTGGHPMLGYDLVEKKLVVNVVEGSQVRAIFKLYLERGSFLSVATELNRRGWTTKSHTARTGRRSGGQSFDKATVQRILTSPIYIGKVEYQGKRYDGAHEAIVDEETFDAVQALLESHRWDRDWKVRSKWGALLMGLVRCHCGSALTHHYVSKGGKRFHYYVCEKTLKKGAAACPKSRIAMRKLETAVVEKIRAIGQDPGLLKETAAALKREREERMPELQTEARPLEKELKRLKTERKDLLQAMDRDDNGAPGRIEHLQELEERLGKVAGRLKEVEGDIAALKAHSNDEDELKEALKAFGPVWSALFPMEQSRVLRLLIASITFNGQDQTVEIRFRPNGITTLAAEFEEEAAA